MFDALIGNMTKQITDEEEQTIVYVGWMGPTK
jgi:hypothetical protein